jgi:hypothetical protein
MIKRRNKKKEISHLCRKNDFFATGKLVAQNFAFFEIAKYAIKISFTLKIVELLTLHLVVYFGFFNKTY